MLQLAYVCVHLGRVTRLAFEHPLIPFENVVLAKANPYA